MSKLELDYKLSGVSGLMKTLAIAYAHDKFPTKLSNKALIWYWSFIDEPMSVHKEDRYFNIEYKAEHWGNASSTCLTARLDLGDDFLPLC
jgi:hypothetical protein